MPVGSRRKPPQQPKHRRAATTMPSSSAAAAAVAQPRHLRRAAAALAGVLLLLLVAYAAWRGTAPPSALLRPLQDMPAATRFYSFDVVHEYPHDPDAFTQGLLYGGNDTLFESTGLYHRSSVREVHLQTGKVLVQHEMDGSLFGEGLTLLGERLFQVTWLKNDGFIYDRHNFSKRESFTHQMDDGWGLATDGKVLFGSDGSSKLYQFYPQSFKVMKMVTVKYNDNEVPYLNELEYINGEVWANIWQGKDQKLHVSTVYLSAAASLPGVIQEYMVQDQNVDLGFANCTMVLLPQLFYHKAAQLLGNKERGPLAIPYVISWKVDCASLMWLCWPVVPSGLLTDKLPCLRSDIDDKLSLILSLHD